MKKLVLDRKFSAVFLVWTTVLFFALAVSCSKKPSGEAPLPIEEGTGSESETKSQDGTESQGETENDGGTESGENKETKEEDTEWYESAMTSLKGATIRTYFDEDFEDKFDAQSFQGSWFYEESSLINEYDPISNDTYETVDFDGHDLVGMPIKEGMLSWEVENPGFSLEDSYVSEMRLYANMGILEERQELEFTLASGTADRYPTDEEGKPIPQKENMMLANFINWDLEGQEDVPIYYNFIKLHVPHQYSVFLANERGKYHAALFVDKVLVAEADSDFGPADFADDFDGFSLLISNHLRSWLNPTGNTEPADVVTFKWNWIEFTPANG